MAKAFISLGTNIKRDYYLAQGLKALESAFGTLELSSLFESDPVGFSGDTFYNMVIGINTELTLAQVCTQMRNIELANGREVNAKKFSARTLDLDLLLFDDVIVKQPAVIPRDEICHNAFVLWPLAEIAENFIHPQLNQTIGQLWQAFDQNSQQLRKIPFQWPS